jgi:sugar phosphate isomerase/epimerase
MLKLCAFADEISADLDEQIQVCRECGIRLIELRGVGGVNVLDFSRQMRSRIKSRLAESGISVACIGSPIGKVKISDPWEAHLERFRIAVELAEFFEARMIRLFSYYPPASGVDRGPWRGEVMRRMRAKVEYVGDRNILLVHENEREIYGERLRECVDLMQTIDSPKLRFAFDFANFIQAGDRPRDNWPALRKFVAHIHIKDARAADGAVVPAGQGDGDIGPILADAYHNGYRGLLSLEPHLSAAGQFSGFTGAKLFRTAVDALREVCREAGVPLEVE